MHDWLRARTAASPAALALISDNQQWRYDQLDQLTDGVVSQLVAAGVKTGDNVAVHLPNGLPYVCLIHGLARMGAVLVPLNTRLTAAELGWQLELTTPTLLIHDDDGLPAALAAQGWRGSTRSAHAMMAAPDRNTAGVPINLPDFQLERSQAIVFTSGTTGHPKGAQLTFANHFWSATASAFRLGLIPTDRWLSCLPLYHVGGLAVLLRACLYGTAVILHPRFEPATFLTSLTKDQATLTSLVPTMLQRLLTLDDAPWPSSMRLVLLGGAAASAALVETSQARDIPVATTYGLTEAASQVATLMPAGAARKAASVGRPLIFTEVRVADADGRTQTVGEIGEIVVSGPTIMAGYYKNPAATTAVLRGGELFTGDMGYLDEEGDLWVVQRRSDIIVTGGENVYPAQVEAVLEAHPHVARACVIGLPDDEWGQSVAALVEVAPDQTPVTADDLITFARQELAGYKVPRYIVFTDALPLTASGKIARNQAAVMLQHQPRNGLNG